MLSEVRGRVLNCSTLKPRKEPTLAPSTGREDLLQKRASRNKLPSLWSLSEEAAVCARKSGQLWEMSVGDNGQSPLCPEVILSQRNCTWREEENPNHQQVLTSNGPLNHPPVLSKNYSPERVQDSAALSKNSYCKRCDYEPQSPAKRLF